MTNYMNQWIKKKFKELREKSKCSKCGSDKNIEFHHIKPTNLKGWNRGRKERYYDIVKNPDCYIPLCKSCHNAEKNV